MKKNNLSLIRTIFYIMIYSVTLLMFTITVIAIARSYRLYLNEIEEMRSISYSQHEEKIQTEVEKVIYWVTQVKEYNDQLPAENRVSEAYLQEYVINSLKDERFDKEGYFFGSAQKGEPLFSDGKITRGTGNIWDLSDPEGVMIIQEQHEAFKEPKGVFVQYSWQKLGETKLSPKLSYTKAIPSWNWVIGTGVYLDDINHQIALKKEVLSRELVNIVLIYLVILIVYFGISYIIIKGIAAQTKKNISTMSWFFMKAAENYETIDSGQLNYPEFRKIAGFANKMIAKRKAIDETLKRNVDKYHKVINNTSEGFLMVDQNFKTIEVNTALCTMLGHEPENNLPGDFLTEENTMQLQEKIEEDKENIHCSFEMEFKKKDGQLLPCFVKSTKLFDDNENLHAIFSFITDITSRKKYEKELAQYRNHLEDLVRERTEDLQKKNDELKNFNKLFIGREFRIKELRTKIEKLEKQLEH